MITVLLRVNLAVEDVFVHQVLGHLQRSHIVQQRPKTEIGRLLSHIRWNRASLMSQVTRQVSTDQKGKIKLQLAL